MTKTDELPIYLILYKYQKYLYKLIHHFKKEYKYTLGQTILDLNWQMIDLVIAANSLPNNQKLPKIRKLSACFDKLKLRLRMAHELELINHKKYSYIIKQHEKIGKMIYGWLNWAKKKA